eukprot:SAG31_NODE_134_length_23213_cov_5.698624_8_plen_107_part_00
MKYYRGVVLHRYRQLDSGTFLTGTRGPKFSIGTGHRSTGYVPTTVRSGFWSTGLNLDGSLNFTSKYSSVHSCILYGVGWELHEAAVYLFTAVGTHTSKYHHEFVSL